MQLTQCPACKGTVSSTAPACPHCGHAMERDHGGCLGALNRIAIATLIAIAVAIIIFLIGTR